MSRVELSAGEVLARVGEMGSECYVVSSGEMQLVTASGEEADYLEEDSVIGALGLVYETPSAFAIVATSDTSLWKLSRFTFQRVLRSEAISRRRDIFSFLRSTSAFAAAPIACRSSGCLRADRARALLLVGLPLALGVVLHVGEHPHRYASQPLAARRTLEEGVQ